MYTFCTVALSLFGIVRQKQKKRGGGGGGEAQCITMLGPCLQRCFHIRPLTTA